MELHDVDEALTRRDVLKRSEGMALLLFLGYKLTAVGAWRRLPIRWERHRGAFSSDFSPRGFDVEGLDCLVGTSERPLRLRFWRVPPYVGVIRSK